MTAADVNGTISFKFITGKNSISESIVPFVKKLGYKVPRMVLYEMNVLYVDQKSKMATNAGHSLT